MGKPKYFKICVLANLMQFIPTKGGLFKQIEFVNSLMFYISTVDPQILLRSQSFVVLLIVCVTKTKDVSKHSDVEEAEN
jgi:hypothetical protein